jgi:putative tricarboxylic transport membrane protein
MTHNRIGGLFFLTLSLAYGIFAWRLPLFILAQGQTITARTMPLALSLLGILLSGCLILQRGQPVDHQDKPDTELQWKTILLLIASMSIYGMLLETLGFILASLVFLNAGFWILGERRFLRMLSVSGFITGVLWLLLSLVFDLYLPAGSILEGGW